LIVPAGKEKDFFAKIKKEMEENQTPQPEINREELRQA